MIDWIKQPHFVILSLLVICNGVLLFCIFASNDQPMVLVEHNKPSVLGTMPDHPYLIPLPAITIPKHRETSFADKEKIKDISINLPIQQAGEDISGASWVLWVKDFDNIQDATHLADRLFADNIKSYKVESKKKWQVFVGPFVNRGYMLSIQKQLLEKGLQSVVNRYLF